MRNPLQTYAIAACALAATVACGPSIPAQEAEGLDLVIVYDTSGSMQDEVRDATGRNVPKHVIASRALANTVNLLEAYAREGLASRAIRVGLVVFRSGGAVEAVPFGPFDAKAFRAWLGRTPSPRGSTPLGRSLQKAWSLVLKSPLSRNHILVITDGENTSGPEPEEVLGRIVAQARLENTTVGVHFVAFDVDASLFNGVKRLGATVVSAADEPQLNEQLSFIMERKILLEAEEAPMPSTTRSAE